MAKRTSGLHWHKSLVGRLLIRFWLSLLIFVFIIGIVQYETLSDFLLKGQEENLQAQFSMLGQKEIEDWLLHAKPYPSNLPDLSTGTTVAFLSQKGQLQKVLGRRDQVGKGIMARDKTIIGQIFNKKPFKTRFVLKALNGDRYMILVYPINRITNTTETIPAEASNVAQGTIAKQVIGYVLIGTPIKQVDNILNHQLEIYIGNGLMILILGGFTTLYILRRPLSPLLNISKVTEKIAAGDYALRIPPQTDIPEEIEHLRDALNNMLSTLENALDEEKLAREQMSRFIADASHELRTPLTSIRGFLEILLRGGNNDPKTLLSAHKTMLIETERLIRLTEDLITLNHLARGSTNNDLVLVSTPIQEVLSELFPLLHSLAGTRILNINTGDIQFVSLEPNELKQILYNLVQNSIQHTSENGEITVVMVQESDGISINVIDNGEGISNNDLPHLFERFYRGSRSRQKRFGKGAGLGLAIVWDIVHLRGGKIEVKNNPDQGSTFHLFLPNADNTRTVQVPN